MSEWVFFVEVSSSILGESSPPCRWKTIKFPVSHFALNWNWGDCVLHAQEEKASFVTTYVDSGRFEGMTYSDDLISPQCWREANRKKIKRYWRWEKGTWPVVLCGCWQEAGKWIGVECRKTALNSIWIVSWSCRAHQRLDISPVLSQIMTWITSILLSG